MSTGKYIRIKPIWNKGLTKGTDKRLDYVRPTSFKKGLIPHNKKIKDNKICIFCFKTYLPCYKKQKYCSSKCFSEATIKNKKIPMNVLIKRSMTRRKINIFDGFATSTNRLLRTNPHWKIWREKVFIRDDFTCQKCNMRGVYIEAYHIIHVKNCIKNNDLELVFNVENGMTLCRSCHKLIHNWNIKNKESD